MSVQEWAGRSDQDVEATASWLDEIGLAGPAYLLLYGLRPVSFIGGQGLLFLQPLLPLGTWRTAAGRFAAILDDRSRLDTLVTLLEARLRSRKKAQDKEDGG